MALRAPLDEYWKAHPDAPEAMDVCDWDVLRHFCRFLEIIANTTRRLEADNVVTIGKALQRLHKLRVALCECANDMDKGPLKGIRHGVQSMLTKLNKEMDDPNWMFALAFGAYMDPSGEWSARSASVEPTRLNVALTCTS